MEFIDQYVYNKYKDSDFVNFGWFKKTLSINDKKLLDRIHPYLIYVNITKYQCKKYGCTLFRQDYTIKNQKDINEKKYHNSVMRKYMRRKYYEQK